MKPKSFSGLSQTLADLFFQTPVAMAYLKGEDMIIEAANERILQIWGKQRPVIGLPMLEALPEMAHQQFPGLFREVLRSGKEFSGNEVKADLERNGILERRYFDFLCAPIREAGDEITGVSIVAYDVTDLVRSRTLLEESEQRFRNLIEENTVPTSLFIGREMRIYLANEAMIAVWGKDRSVIGKKLQDALPELEGQPFLNLLDEVYRTGITYVGKQERADLVVDGRLQTFYYDFSYKALRDKDGEIYGILNSSINVTDQVVAQRIVQQSQAALKESQDRLIELADSMPQQVWATDEKGGVAFINRVAADFFGVGAEGFPDSGGMSLIHPDDRDMATHKWKISCRDLSRYEAEYRLRDKDGNYRYFLGRALPIVSPEGKTLRWIGTNTDIDELKKLQRQKDDFIGIASHELKTPVTSIKAYTQVLEAMLRKEGDHQKADLLAKMDGQLNKFNALINDLLDTTKIQSGKMQFNEEYFVFNELVMEIIEEIQRTSSQHIIIPELGKTGKVWADRERIGQVISNLLTNAIKYSPDGKEIIVKTVAAGQYAQLSVTDFGIGIPPDQKELVFQQFYRVSGMREHTFPGIGLGLYICSEIIRREGGEIWVDTEPEKGSTFHFKLPFEKPNHDRETDTD